MTVASNDYQQLIQPVEGRLIRSIARILQNPSDAEEALQETLETIWNQFHKVRRHPNPQALMLRMAMNAAYNLLRRKSCQRQIQTVSLYLAIDSTESSILDRLSLEEQRNEIYAAIRSLSRKQAQAVLMRFFQDLSFTEIAEGLGCSEATARTHVKRGCAHLRKLLVQPLSMQKQEVQS